MLLPVSTKVGAECKLKAMTVQQTAVGFSRANHDSLSLMIVFQLNNDRNRQTKQSSLIHMN